MTEAKTQHLDALIYTPAEAARLVGLHATTVRRWLYGHATVNRKTGARVAKRGLVARGKSEGASYLSFLDLVELGFLKACRDRGVSTAKMRKALEEARDLYGVDHPFARQRFLTDGKNLYAAAEDGDKETLLELCSGGQWAFPDVIKSFATEIDFSPVTEFAIRWRPSRGGGLVVIDPNVGFGRPVVKRTGIRTENVYDLYVAEGGDTERVAWWFDIGREQVEAAVRFEEAQHRKAA